MPHARPCSLYGAGLPVLPGFEGISMKGKPTEQDAALVSIGRFGHSLYDRIGSL
jgi:hypothetical protein